MEYKSLRTANAADCHPGPSMDVGHNMDHVQRGELGKINKISSEAALPVILVKRNATRGRMNWIGLNKMIDQTKGVVMVFPATHGRCWTMTGSELLTLDESSGGSCGPGMFLFTHNMPVVLNKNLNTEQGIVNGMAGKAVGIVVNEEMQGGKTAMTGN